MKPGFLNTLLPCFIVAPPLPPCQQIQSCIQAKLTTPATAGLLNSPSLVGSYYQLIGSPIKQALFYISSTKTSPLTKTRKTSLLFLMDDTNGASVFSNLEEMIDGGGTKIVTFCLKGKLNIIFHFDTSGNWSCSILKVFCVAVAVISTSLPPKVDSSPVERAIAGRNAALVSLSKPQFTTARQNIDLTLVPKKIVDFSTKVRGGQRRIFH